MIIVFSPLMQEDIINEMENFIVDGNSIFSIKEKKGMRLTFNSTIEDQDEACKVAKNIMRGYKYSRGLNYYVAPFDGKEIKWF